MELLIDILLALGIAAILRGFVFTLVCVKGFSMSDTLKNGDRLFATKLDLILQSPGAGRSCLPLPGFAPQELYQARDRFAGRYAGDKRRRDVHKRRGAVGAVCCASDAARLCAGYAGRRRVFRNGRQSRMFARQPRRRPAWAQADIRRGQTETVAARRQNATLECVSKIPEYAISGGAVPFLRHKARLSTAKPSGVLP